MVAPLVAAAGIGAVGSLLGGAAGGKGAKKAAKIQQQTAREQIAAANANRDYQYGLNEGTIDQGERAGDLVSNFVGLDGGDAAADALATYRGSTGYEDLVREGLGAVNANAYANGKGDSGATLKRLQERGMSFADRSAGSWLGQVNNLASRGDQARGLVAGVGLSTVNMTNQSSQNAADASSNAALFQAGNTSSIIQNLMNAGAYAYGSSYGGNNVMGRGGVFGNPGSGY